MTLAVLDCRPWQGVMTVKDETEKATTANVTRESGGPRDDADAISLNCLLERVATNDRAALKTLYDLMSSRLFAVLLRMVRRREVAEDLLQDVFVTIWKKAHQFDVARGNAYAWLFSMTRRKAIDRLRLSSREVLAGDAEGFHFDAEPDLRWTDAEIHIALKRGLQGLKPDVHRALQLCYTYGLTHEELALEMQVPVGTAKSWVRRGLAQLRECLTAQ